MAEIIHGQKFRTKHKTKCGLWIGSLGVAPIVAGACNISKVTCKDCIKNHKPGKC